LIPIRRRPPSEYISKRDRGGMNATQYINEILEPHLLPFYQDISQSADLDNETYEVIEDLSGPHKATITTAFYQKHGIKKSRWPAKSPDLNAIENTWSMLKTRLKKRYLKGDLKTQNEFIVAAKEEWELLDWENIYCTLIDGMPRRIKAVIEAEGHRTKY